MLEREGRVEFRRTSLRDVRKGHHPVFFIEQPGDNCSHQLPCIDEYRSAVRSHRPGNTTREYIELDLSHFRDLP